jgi:hypothetical protein
MGGEQAGRIPPKPFSVVATEVRGDDRKHALPWHGAVYERSLAENAKTPPLQRDEPHTAWCSQRCQIQICSLRAEADGDLRVGARIE